MDKKLLYKKFIKAICSYPSYLNKRLFLIRPCSVTISKSAEIDIQGYCYFNSEFDSRRVWKNKTSGRLFLADKSVIKLNSTTFYSGITLSVNKNAVLTIGKSYFSYDCRIACFNSIKIGDGCAISQNVSIRDSDNHEILRDGFEKSAPIIIEDNVWIGINVTILKGVQIGEGSVVAAGAVVTNSCPPHSLIAGVPDRIIRSDVYWK